MDDTTREDPGFDDHDSTMLVLTRVLPVTPRALWPWLTTAEAIAATWAPDGFTAHVDELDLRAGGSLVYSMTATGQEQVAFMESAGLPLSSTSRKIFTEIDEPHRLSYLSVIDFVPDHPTYDQLTTVTLREVEDGTSVEMALAPMHNEEWTQRVLAGRSNELDHLAQALGAG